MSKKPSKEDFERIFNELFGTHIKWGKLSRDELVELATILNHPEVILGKLGVDTDEFKGSLIKGKLLDAGKDLVSTWLEMWDGPLARLARRVLGSEGEADESSADTSVTR